jgi:hypothetical protein
VTRVPKRPGPLLSRQLHEQCKRREQKGVPEYDYRRRLGLQLSVQPEVALAADRAVRLVALAADEDPELGLLGVLGLRQVAQVCEEHQGRQAREDRWTWAQIPTALEVSPQAMHQRHAARLATSLPPER